MPQATARLYRDAMILLQRVALYSGDPRMIRQARDDIGRIGRREVAPDGHYFTALKRAVQQLEERHRLRPGSPAWAARRAHGPRDRPPAVAAPARADAAGPAGRRPGERI